MTSYMRDKISRATGSSSEKINAEEAEKYRLLVTAGPSYNLSEHKIIPVNQEETSTFIENEFLRAKITVRVRDFRGLPSSSPSSSSYFEHPVHEKDQYSVAFSFVPKQDLPSEGSVWGNDLDHPIRDRIPPGFNTAFKIVKEFIDPGLSCDVYAEEPWLYGPSLSCWFAFRIGEMVGEGEEFPSPAEGVLTEGADGSGREVRYKHNLPENNEKRRKVFLSAQNRENFVFEKGRVYQGDFYNPYIMFSNFSLRLPGFSLKVLKYIGEKTHCLRYVFKSRETGDVYFNVNFTLLWGEQLKKALEQDREHHLQASAGAEVDGDALGEGDESDEEYHSMDEEDGEDAQAEAGAPPTMQLHPGDHTAHANHLIEKAGVDEIDRMLRNTTTSQHQGGPLLDDVD